MNIGIIFAPSYSILNSETQSQILPTLTIPVNSLYTSLFICYQFQLTGKDDESEFKCNCDTDMCNYMAVTETTRSNSITTTTTSVDAFTTITSGTTKTTINTDTMSTSTTPTSTTTATIGTTTTANTTTQLPVSPFLVVVFVVVILIRW